MSLKPTRISVTSESKVWRDGATSGTSITMDFEVPEGTVNQRDIAVDIYRESHRLHLHCINTLMLNGAISAKEADDRKRGITMKYKKFLTGEADESESA